MFKYDRNYVLNTTKATYPGRRSNHICFYNDASANAKGSAGAFADIADAIGQAEEFIFIVGWSFHPDFYLQRLAKAKRIGELLLEKARANPEMVIAIMPWCHKSIPGMGVVTGDAENNAGDAKLREIWEELKNAKRLEGEDALFPANVVWRASPYDKTNSYSHHQKFLVCDAPADEANPKGTRILRAFFGGLDITKGRFDWPEHPFMPESNTEEIFGKQFDDWYNCEFGGDDATVRQPWHDIHAGVVGPCTWDFVREFTARWCADQYYKMFGMKPLGDGSTASIALVFDKYQQLVSGADSRGRKLVGPNEKQPTWKPKRVRDTTRLWKTQVLRSINKIGWGKPNRAALSWCKKDPTKTLLKDFTWNPKLEKKYERSIQDAYLEMIPVAKNFIYIESQYLVSSGKYWGQTAYENRRKSVKNSVAEVIVDRLKKAVQKAEPFHVYIVLPMFPEGSPADTAMYPIRFLQWCTIEYMVKELYNVCGPEWRNYLSFYCLGNWNSTNVYRAQAAATRSERVVAAQRYMVYVHSKMMIVDDRSAIIGSANLNERSLNGDRDSEICVAMWPDERKLRLAEAQLRGFRTSLWNEHLGASWMKKFGGLNPGSRECVQRVGEAATDNFFNFLAGKRVAGSGHLLQWPIETDGQGKFGFTTDFIADFPSDKTVSQWTWHGSTNAFSQMPLSSKVPE